MKVYVANSQSKNVSVIDTATNTVCATIATGDGPVNPTVTPDGKQIYVSNMLGSSISIIDVASNVVTGTIDVAAAAPSGLAFTPDGQRLVVTLLGDNPKAP